MRMKEKTKNKKIRRNKVFKKALAFFCFFIFTFSLANLNYFNNNYDFSIISVEAAEKLDTAKGTLTNEKSTEDLLGSSNWLVRGVNWILYGFFCFFGWVLGLVAYIFDWAVDADNIRHIIHREAIYNAWKMVRDFLNLGFILILLYSAFCTVFQIEKYHLKKIILMLVLMALLVNFSFPISRFIVDASNVTMYFFLQSAFGDTDTRSFSAALTGQTNIVDNLVPRNKDNSFDSKGSTTEIIVAIFFIISLMIVMFVIAAILVIRIMALAILIIFSSIGFVAAVFPDTKTFANKWWSTLFKYAFAGPILVFMMLLALNLMRELAVEGTLDNMTKTAQNYGTDPSKLANAAYFFLPVVLLWMGVFATRTMSIFGANWVTGKATGVAKWMGKAGLKKGERAFLAGTPVKEGGRLSKIPGLGKLAGKSYNLSPRAFVQGWKERAKRVDEEFLGTATGGWHDTLNRTFSLGKEKTSYKYQAQQALAAKEQKRLIDINEHSDYLMSEFENLEGSNDPKKAQKMQAIFKTLFKNNDANEMIKWFGGDEGDVTPENVKKFVAGNLKKAGMKEEEIGLHLMELGNIAFGQGNYGLYGMGTFDKGRFKVSNDKEQAMAAAGKIVNVESQQKMRNWHWNSILTEKGKGGVGELHSTGKELLKKLTQGEVHYVNRARTDFLDNLSLREDDIRNFANKEVDKEQGKIINEFMDAIMEQKRSHKEKNEEGQKKKEVMLDEHAKMI